MNKMYKFDKVWALHAHKTGIKKVDNNSAKETYFLVSENRATVIKYSDITSPNIWHTIVTV